VCQVQGRKAREMEEMTLTHKQSSTQSHTHTYTSNCAHNHTHIQFWPNLKLNNPCMIHIYTYVHTHNIRIHTYIHTYVHTHTYIYTHICTYAYIHIYTHMYIHSHPVHCAIPCGRVLATHRWSGAARACQPRGERTSAARAPACTRP